MKGEAPAKINLGLVVGPRRPDGKHELVTVFQRLDLADRIAVEPSDVLLVEGFADDTLVASALAALEAPHAWRARIDKQIPVAAGLGGGSSDAATALRLGNAQIAQPLDDRRLHALATALGADVPFFLRAGPQLGTGDGTTLEPVTLPQDYSVCLLLPLGVAKRSTREVYEAFDRTDGAAGFAARAGGVSRGARRRPPRGGSGGAAAERPRHVAALGRAARAGRFPGRRERRRPRRVRALRRPGFGRSRRRGAVAEGRVPCGEPCVVA